MFLSPYYAKQDQSVFISALQASNFAKHVAEDFNPIHNVGAKRFCVPGDLLFALVLTEFGLSKKMKFKFAGMVGDGVELILDQQAGEQFSICDNKGKEYLHIEREGALCQCDVQKAAFIKSYVAFSGLNFIHVLVPMMKQYGMMINPARPLVIYESMSFQLDTFDFTDMSLELVEQDMQINGKRGDVTLQFALKSAGKVIGSGIKTLVLSGLREYDELQAQQMCHSYESSKLA
ncbi:DUF3581 domain-containing protein [Pseudomonadota bacterium]|uniref:DUF3581 domain-containing protein n=1 Tax=unclassified Shewanella TaxID=196818 RepID=UPI000C850C4C|nr:MULTISPECIES: DUF3581 domain-containing protein [unclassified Shewanella]MDO6618019.1 DUF3581 domain-containing protein [Shewanella sp. 6_MG-2023]MDO6640996.1 DUF3581 domain-containing protein [Shewanella sp. 5_MG-2023]MDO6679178.1 DUF3581 domain-containing protein [Shewanella sp. 4_MG-2023]MDO6776479.1 DUF3581 domain-containing protein [Shewanella sp. 3_MG-2023]PMH89236.1 hypothetical protein BCU57_18575 [Shewanella sp. 10N.286.48.B5]